MPKGSPLYGGSDNDALPDRISLGQMLSCDSSMAGTVVLMLQIGNGTGVSTLLGTTIASYCTR